MGEMTHVLPSLSGGAFPLEQPYNTAPWNYNGTESVVVIPADVVDWVLVEIRDASSAITAVPSTSIGKQAAFIMKDGSIMGIDGSTLLVFNAVISNDLFVVIWHRNHLPIINATALSGSAGIYPYDFTDSQSKAYQKGSITTNSAMSQLGSGKYGMWAGDSNADTYVKFNNAGNDKEVVLTKVGSATVSNAVQGYENEDLNLDGYVKYTGNSNDKVVIYNTLDGAVNETYQSHIPD